MTQRVKIELGILITLAVVLGFFSWLKAHDESVAEQAQTEYRTQQLHFDNVKLAAKVKQLEKERDDIAKVTEERVRAEQEARRVADTPQKQVIYVAQEVPGLHLRLPKDDEPPVVTFPVGEMPLLADLVEAKRVAVEKLAGCEADKVKADGIIATQKQEIANRDEEISLLKKSKNATTRQKANWFVRGLAIGAGIAAFLL